MEAVVFSQEVNVVPQTRGQQLSPVLQPFDLMTGRCDRRAFLCEFDHLTNRSSEQRRQPILVDELRSGSSEVEFCAAKICHG
jgi:hypothetical protein